MIVANSFDLWQKDVFLSAAEEVQESADTYVPFVLNLMLIGLYVESHKLYRGSLSNCELFGCTMIKGDNFIYV